MVRLRHRYVLAKINYQDTDAETSAANNNDLFLSTLTQSIRNLHGVTGVAKSKDGLYVQYFNTETNMIIIRMRRHVYKIVVSALALIRSLNNEPVSIQTLYTSATMNHCSSFITKFYKRELESAYGKLTTQGQKEEFARAMQEAASQPVVISLPKKGGKWKGQGSGRGGGVKKK